MEPTITVALIGGTGKAGKYLLDHLLANNISVKLLHRKPDTLTIGHPLLRIIKGDARNADDIQILLQNCSAVLNCVGQPAGEPPITDTATANILTAIEQLKIDRYILLAGLNVDTPSDQKGPQTQAATNWMKQNYPESCAARQTEYKLLTESAIDWTLIRIPMLVQTGGQTDTIIDLYDCPGQQISAASLAKFMADLLVNGDYKKQAPFIADR